MGGQDGASGVAVGVVVGTAGGTKVPTGARVPGVEAAFWPVVPVVAAVPAGAVVPADDPAGAVPVVDGAVVTVPSVAGVVPVEGVVVVLPVEGVVAPVFRGARVPKMGVMVVAVGGTETVGNRALVVGVTVLSLVRLVVWARESPVEAKNRAKIRVANLK